MKFVLKVLVLVCLIVISKLSKEDRLAFQTPVNSASKNSVLSQNIDRFPLAERQVSPTTVKFEKGSLQFN